MYLDLQGYDVPRSDVLEEIMVSVAEGTVDQTELADLLFSIAIA
jgi:death-on-curing protein